MGIFKLKGNGRSFLIRAESKERACIKLRDALAEETKRLGAGIDYAYLTEEERKAIEDYKKAIAATSDPKMLGIFAHLLQEETEHIGELSEAEGVDKYGAIAVPEMVDDSDVVGESLEQTDNTYMDYENGEVISDEKFCPSQLKDASGFEFPGTNMNVVSVYEIETLINRAKINYMDGKRDVARKGVERAIEEMKRAKAQMSQEVVWAKRVNEKLRELEINLKTLYLK